MRYKFYEEHRCETCGHFYRHYTRIKTGGYRATVYGHCSYPRMKLRRLEDTCEKWTSAAPAADTASAPD